MRVRCFFLFVLADLDPPQTSDPELQDRPHHHGATPLKLPF